MQDDNKRLERLLEENLVIAKENKKLLEDMKKRQKVIFWMRVLYFFVVTGFIFGAFYFIAPFLKNFFQVYQNLPNSFPDIMDYVPYLNEARNYMPGGN